MGALAVSRAQPSIFSQHHKLRSACCHAAAPASSAYDWEVLATPRLEEGGRFFVAEERIRSFEVGPNQQSDLVAIANMMQVRSSTFEAGSLQHAWPADGPCCSFLQHVSVRAQRVNQLEVTIVEHLFLRASLMLCPASCHLCRASAGGNWSCRPKQPAGPVRARRHS